MVKSAILSAAICLAVAQPVAAQSSRLPGERDDDAIFLPSDPYYSWGVAHMTHIVRSRLLNPGSAVVSNMIICLYKRDFKMAVVMVSAEGRNKEMVRDRLAVAVETEYGPELIFTQNSTAITLSPYDVDLDVRKLALDSSKTCIEKYTIEAKIVQQHK